MGLTHYESSQNQKLDHRLLSGARIGYAQVPSKGHLLRFAVIPAFEYARYDGQDFGIEVARDGAERMLLRAAILSNGWFRMKDSQASFRYVAQV